MSNSVQLKKRGNVATITVEIDCAEAVERCRCQVEAVEASRSESLKRKELTKEQRASENQKYDIDAESARQSMRVQMFDLAMRALQTAQQRAALSERDAEKAREDAKKAIDAQHDEAEKLRPQFDMD